MAFLVAPGLERPGYLTALKWSSRLGGAEGGSQEVTAKTGNLFIGFLSYEKCD